MLRAYLDNQRKVGYVSEGNGRQRKIDRRQPNVPIPLEYALMLICDRWPGAGAPWHLEADENGDRVRHYMNLMGLEAEIKGDLEGLEPDEPMLWFGED